MGMNNPRLQPYNEYVETEYEQADQYEQVFPTKSKSKSKQVWVWANQYEQVCWLSNQMRGTPTRRHQGEYMKA